MRENPPNPGLWGYTGTVWGTIMGSDDSKTMQRVDARGMNGEMILGAERPQIWGFSSRPMPPEDNGAKGAEVGIVFRGGDLAHPVVVTEGDRRPGYRPKNLKEGESKHHDDQGQNTHIARDGMNHTAKQHVMSATEGDKPLTTFELQEQLKGLGARMSHMEHSHHGLFDVTSQFRQIVQGTIPAVAAVAPILNQDPTGLTKMTDAIKGKVMNYLQTHLQDAIGKFTSPNIGGVGSLMGGADGIIAALTAKIQGLISANPVVATVDGLVDELAALQASGSPAVVAEMAPVIQGLIDSATKGNPIVGQVADMRSQLAGLIGGAGDGLNFLAPQQRMVKGLTKSLKLTQ